MGNCKSKSKTSVDPAASAEKVVLLKPAETEEAQAEKESSPVQVAGAEDTDKEPPAAKEGDESEEKAGEEKEEKAEEEEAASPEAEKEDESPAEEPAKEKAEEEEAASPEAEKENEPATKDDEAPAEDKEAEDKEDKVEAEVEEPAESQPSPKQRGDGPVDLDEVEDDTDADASASANPEEEKPTESWGEFQEKLAAGADKACGTDTAPDEETTSASIDEKDKKKTDAEKGEKGMLDKLEEVLDASTNCCT